MDRRAEGLARAWIGAFTAADRDAFLSLLHPQVEMHLPRSALEGGAPYRGLEGATQAWADAFDLWARFEVESLDFDDAGDRLIFAYKARCFPRRESSPVVDYVAYNVIELRDGRIVYLRPHLERNEAREDADARSGPLGSE